MPISMNPERIELFERLDLIKQENADEILFSNLLLKNPIIAYKPTGLMKVTQSMITNYPFVVTFEPDSSNNQTKKIKLDEPLNIDNNRAPCDITIHPGTKVTNIHELNPNEIDSFISFDISPIDPEHCIFHQEHRPLSDLNQYFDNNTRDKFNESKNNEIVFSISNTLGLELNNDVWQQFVSAKHPGESDISELALNINGKDIKVRQGDFLGYDGQVFSSAYFKQTFTVVAPEDEDFDITLEEYSDSENSLQHKFVLENKAELFSALLKQPSSIDADQTVKQVFERKVALRPFYGSPKEILIGERVAESLLIDLKKIPNLSDSLKTKINSQIDLLKQYDATQVDNIQSAFTNIRSELSTEMQTIKQEKTLENTWVSFLNALVDLYNSTFPGAKPWEKFKPNAEKKLGLFDTAVQKHQDVEILKSPSNPKP